MTEYLYQRNSYSCGTVAIVNAMGVYGLTISYDDAKRLVGTTSRRGTSKAGLMRGIEELGFRAVEYSQKNDDAAWRWLLKNCATYAVILLVDANQHWMSTSGRINNKVVLVDPSINLKEGKSGVEAADKETTLWRWKHKTNYAIKIVR